MAREKLRERLGVHAFGSSVKASDFDKLTLPELKNFLKECGVPVEKRIGCKRDLIKACRQLLRDGIDQAFQEYRESLPPDVGEFRRMMKAYKESDKDFEIYRAREWIEEAKEKSRNNKILSGLDFHWNWENNPKSLEYQRKLSLCKFQREKRRQKGKIAVFSFQNKDSDKVNEYKKILKQEEMRRKTQKQCSWSTEYKKLKYICTNEVFDEKVSRLCVYHLEYCLQCKSNKIITYPNKYGLCEGHYFVKTGESIKSVSKVSKIKDLYLGWRSLPGVKTFSRTKVFSSELKQSEIDEDSVNSSSFSSETVDKIEEKLVLRPSPFLLYLKIKKYLDKSYKSIDLNKIISLKYKYRYKLRKLLFSNYFATKIQRTYKTYKTYKLFQDLLQKSRLDKKRRASVVIQSHVRGINSRRITRREFHFKEVVARKLQKLKHKRDLKSNVTESVYIIQRAIRSYLDELRVGEIVVMREVKQKRVKRICAMIRITQFMTKIKRRRRARKVFDLAENNKVRFLKYKFLNVLKHLMKERREIEAKVEIFKREIAAKRIRRLNRVRISKIIDRCLLNKLNQEKKKKILKIQCFLRIIKAKKKLKSLLEKKRRKILRDQMILRELRKRKERANTSQKLLMEQRIEKEIEKMKADYLIKSYIEENTSTYQQNKEYMKPRKQTNIYVDKRYVVPSETLNSILFCKWK